MGLNLSGIPKLVPRPILMGPSNPLLAALLHNFPRSHSRGILLQHSRPPIGSPESHMNAINGLNCPTILFIHRRGRCINCKGASVIGVPPFNGARHVLSAVNSCCQIWLKSCRQSVPRAHFRVHNIAGMLTLQSCVPQIPDFGV